MHSVRIDGHEYRVGWHRTLGLMVHAHRWQGSVPEDRVRLLVVSETRLATFVKRVVRPKLDLLPDNLPSSDIHDIKKLSAASLAASR